VYSDQNRCFIPSPTVSLCSYNSATKRGTSKQYGYVIRVLYFIKPIDLTKWIDADGYPGLKKISGANMKHAKYTKDKPEAQRHAAQVGRRVLAELKRIDQYLTTPSF
jgi:hypothetical protein